MTRMVDCVVLKRQAEGLKEPPYPGELGERIYQSVSKEGWVEWLKRLQLIMNELQLNSADPDCHKVIEQHMLGFLFSEGEHGDVPQGFQAPGN